MPFNKAAGSMRHLCTLLISVIMLLCVAPAMEPDMCMLENAGCPCCMSHDHCGNECDCGCDCCSPFISCVTCSGFEIMRVVRLGKPVENLVLELAITPLDDLTAPIILIPTLPPVHC